MGVINTIMAILTKPDDVEVEQKTYDQTIEEIKSYKELSEYEKNMLEYSLRDIADLEHTQEVSFVNDAKKLINKVKVDENKAREKSESKIKEETEIVEEKNKEI